MKYDRRRLKWNGWGWREESFSLDDPAAFWHFVREELGLDRLPDTPSVPFDAIDLPDPRLSDEQLHTLRDLLGEERVRTGDYERLFHATGRSYKDLIRLRTGAIEHAPDAVVYPETHDGVERIVTFAAQHALALVPFGGGSSVVGGVDAIGSDEQQGVITLDTAHLNRLVDFNPAARTATFQAGIYGPVLERALQKRGHTLGHFPQSFEFSTLGGWIAARSAGQFSDRYGKAEDFLLDARVVSPESTWSTPEIPASATGPDLNELIAGSEGALGIITEATIAIHPTPPVERTYMVLFKHFSEGLYAAQQLRQRDDLPLAMIRLSDAEETRFLLRFRSSSSASLGRQLYKQWLRARGFTDHPALMLVGLTGRPFQVKQGEARVLRICTRSGGAFAGTQSDWRSGHYAMPYLRDDLMDRGIGVDTVETATRWPNVPHLHQAVCRAAASHAAEAGYRCLVLGHVSHSYSDGACLYFTLVFPMDIGRELDQWCALKTAVSDTIVEYGGTISHHHGVGRDHQPWLQREQSTVPTGVVQAVKDYLDPQGTMNPGKLVP